MKASKESTSLPTPWDPDKTDAYPPLLRGKTPRPNRRYNVQARHNSLWSPHDIRMSSATALKLRLETVQILIL